MNTWFEGLSNADLGTIAVLFIALILGLLGWAAYQWTPKRRIRRLDKRTRGVKWENMRLR